MPRVAHVVSSPEGVGGAERVVASLARGALERGWEPLVINPFSSDPNRSALSEICEPAAYVGRAGRSWQQLPGLRHWLGRVVHDFAPDILHAHLFHAEVAVASLQVSPSTRSLLTHHHGDHFVYLGKRWDAHLDRWAGRRFDSVVAVSKWVRRFLLETYRYPDRKVEMIRNGWSGDPQADGSNGRPPTVISVANFRQQKGHADLLHAFARVRRQVPAARLVLIGEGELHDDLEAIATQLGIQGAVEFKGNVDDVWPHLATADVFALGSIYEPLGIAVMEAMAAGLPVVATTVGGIPEVVDPHETGLLAAPRDPVALAEGLIALLKSSELRRRFGRAARERAQGMRMDRTVDQYFSLYAGLIQKGLPG
jgi:L-malate glycosyltransferase